MEDEGERIDHSDLLVKTSVSSSSVLGLRQDSPDCLGLGRQALSSFLLAVSSSLGFSSFFLEKSSCLSRRVLFLVSTSPPARGETGRCAGEGDRPPPALGESRDWGGQWVILGRKVRGVM